MRSKRSSRQALESRYVLTANSGSSANLLAVSALTSHMLGNDALKPGDEVITCATGFPTTVNPILQNGLVPVFVDVSLPTYNIAVEAIEAAVTRAHPRDRAGAYAGQSVRSQQHHGASRKSTICTSSRIAAMRWVRAMTAKPSADLARSPR